MQLLHIDDHTLVVIRGLSMVAHLQTTPTSQCCDLLAVGCHPLLFVYAACTSQPPCIATCVCVVVLRSHCCKRSHAAMHAAMQIVQWYSAAGTTWVSTCVVLTEPLRYVFVVCLDHFLHLRASPQVVITIHTSSCIGVPCRMSCVSIHRVELLHLFSLPSHARLYIF